MIKGDINLQELALTRGGEATYANARAYTFNQHHRKAKSQLNRTIVFNLTTFPSPYQMARNVMHGKDGPMELHPDLLHLGNVATLKALFESDHLYTDAKVHALWVGLFASGKVYGCNRAGTKATLDQMIDIDYEAHARYEISSRLSCQGWTHGYTADYLAERSAGFRKIRKLVRIDRLNNLAAAEAIRLKTVLAADVDLCKSQALCSGGLADTTDEEDDF
jgi:hypothetical protein